MRDKIRRFVRRSTDPSLVVRYTGKQTIIKYAKNFFSYYRILFHTFVISFCKLLTPRPAIFLYRRMLKMKVGNNVGLVNGLELDRIHPSLIEIEDDVIIGWKATIMAHEFTHNKLRFGRVLIKKGALIGAHAIIRCGVTIGENSVVAMCSYVMKDIPDNQIWGGNPARYIRDVTPEDIDPQDPQF
ncbi:MAG: acyltransferase [Spirochaeta sp.]